MSLRNLAKRTIKSLPILRGHFRRNEECINALTTRISQLDAEVARLLEEEKKFHGLLHPPGHHYSPIVSLTEIRRREEKVFALPAAIPGIDLNEAVQLRLLDQLSAFYAELPFPERKEPGMRYYYENDWYSYTDAIVLHGMIRFLAPKRIIEIGSGFSSSVILDTNALFFQGHIECQFIDPEPERLLSLLHEGEKDRIRLIDRGLQDVDDGIFRELQENDILFVDSSHVFKTGSDVNLLLGEILSSLQRGVWIHFHDIFYPFEYPKEWVYEGRSWNEAYAIRAFLQHNDVFSIQFFTDFLAQLHKELLISRMPLCARNTGASLWLRKER
jgi:hypothetical protein